jgi:hypothetical protein
MLLSGRFYIYVNEESGEARQIEQSINCSNVSALPCRTARLRDSRGLMRERNMQAKFLRLCAGGCTLAGIRVGAAIERAAYQLSRRGHFEDTEFMTDFPWN